jgi:hypothetical protein
MAYTMTTDKTEAQSRREIVGEFTKWNNDKPRTIGAYDFPAPEKIGAAEAIVRFELRGAGVTMRCSSQGSYRLNLRCLFYAVEAMRMNEKRGIADTIREAYAQLPPPSNLPAKSVNPFEFTDPYDVLQVARGAPLAICEASYKVLINLAHPDKGGSDAQAAQLNAAIAKVREA